MEINITPDRFGKTSFRSMEWIHFTKILRMFGFVFHWVGPDGDYGCIKDVSIGKSFYSPALGHSNIDQRRTATRWWMISWFEGYLYGKYGYIND